MLYERMRKKSLFLSDIIALRIMGVFSKYSMLTRARYKNPQEVWDAFHFSWVGVFGTPKSSHLGEGGEWESELWRDLCVERRITLVFQGVGAHPWILERRNGLARGIYNRLQADRYYTGSQIQTEVQRRLNTLVSASGYSGYQLVLFPTRWISMEGMTPTKISCLLNTHRFRVSLRNSGSFAFAHKKLR